MENTGTSLTRPIYDWFHVGEHYIYEWLAERPPPTTGVEDDLVSSMSPPISLLQSSIDEDVEMGHTMSSVLPLVGSGSAPVLDPGFT